MKIGINIKNNVKEDLCGKEIFLIKNETKYLSDYQIDCYLDNRIIGNVCEDTLPEGYSNAQDIYEIFPDKGIKSKIIREKEINQEKVISIIEVDDLNNNTNNRNVNRKVFVLKVIGSVKTYPMKMECLRRFNEGQQVLVDINLQKESLITILEKNLAGIISDKKNSIEDINVIKLLLKNKEEIKGKITSIENNTYSIKIEIEEEKIKNLIEEEKKETLNEIKKNLINSSIISEEKLNKIEDYLIENNFKSNIISAIFKTYKKYSEDVAELIPTPKIKFKDNDNLLMDGIISILEGLPILCIGEKGTGKNIFIENLSWIFNRPLYTVSINSQTDKMDLTGSKTLTSSIEEGQVLTKIEYSKDTVIKAVEEGGILNIDEINFANPGVTGLLHSLLDSRRTLNVSDYGKVVANENFQFIGTMNAGYSGTTQLNEALSDRFVDLIFPQTNNIEGVLKENCPNAPLINIVSCQKIYEKIKIMIADGSLDENASTVRGFVQALKLSNSGTIPLKRALKRCVADKIFDDIEYRENITNIINTYI